MKNLLSFGLSVFLSINLFAQQLQPLPIDPNVRIGRLENGLTYYIRHNTNPQERADFFLVLNVGAILENDDQNGLAHFLEHMAFNGTTNFPGNRIDEYLQTIGVRFGELNAYVSLDETVYQIRNVPTTNSEVIDTLLLILHDWSSAISLEADAIEIERGVILEEWRTGMGAEWRMWTESNRLRFPGSQYAIRNVIGDSAVIVNFEHQTLRDFYEKWHRPDLQAVIVVGDIDVDAIEQQIKTLFSYIPRHEHYGHRPVFPIYDSEEPIIAIVTDPEARFTRIELIYKHDRLSADFRLSVNGFLLNTINSLISTMIQNRFQEITMQADASFVGGFAYYGDLVRSKDAFYMVVAPHEGREFEGLKALLLETEKINRYGFTVSEFERARIDLMRTVENAYNERNNQRNTALVQQYLQHFLNAEPIPGIEWQYEALKEMLPQLNVEMINQMVARHIHDDGSNMIVSIQAPESPKVIIPSEEQILVAIEYVRTAEITPREEDVLDQPLIERSPRPGRIRQTTQNQNFGTTEWTLSNGVRVIIKTTDFRQDEILMSAHSRGGLAKITNLEDLPSATFATDIVTSNGLGNFSAIELQRALTGKIANVTPFINNMEEGFTGNSSVADFETMMQLVYLYFTAPRQDDNSFQALMNMYRTFLGNRDRDPRTTFSDSINTLMVNRSPRLVIQNLETLNRVNQERAIEIFRQRFAHPADFVFVFTGNIDPNNPVVRRAITTYLGGLSARRVVLENYTDDGVRRPEGIIRNYFTREMQNPLASNFVLYSAEIPFNLQNRVAMDAIGQILFHRYFETIRREEGGTYGVGVRGWLNKTPINHASILMQFDTNTNMQEHLMSIIHAEIEELANFGPREEDLQNVKENLLKRYEQDLRENAWWRDALSHYHRSGINLIQDYQSAVENLTPRTIRWLVRDIVRQGNMLEIVMLPEEE